MDSKNAGVTQYDALAELCAWLTELLQTAGIHTDQAYQYAAQAFDWLEIALEEYEK